MSAPAVTPAEEARLIDLAIGLVPLDPPLTDTGRAALIAAGLVRDAEVYRGVVITEAGRQRVRALARAGLSLQPGDTHAPQVQV